MVVVLGLGLVAFCILGLLKRERMRNPVNPCQAAGGRGLCIIYMPGQHAAGGGEPGGCALCDADNVEPWNALYKIYGGREDIEFVVILPQERSSRRKLDFRHDRRLIQDNATWAEQDAVVLCDGGEKKLEHTGIMDMAFARRVNEILSRAQVEEP